MRYYQIIVKLRLWEDYQLQTGYVFDVLLFWTAGNPAVAAAQQ